MSKRIKMAKMNNNKSKNDYQHKTLLHTDTGDDSLNSRRRGFSRVHGGLLG